MGADTWTSKFYDENGDLYEVNPFYYGGRPIKIDRNPEPPPPKVSRETAGFVSVEFNPSFKGETLDGFDLSDPEAGE
jgi:hypothetical protein